MKILLPQNWERPSGYSHGVVSEGQLVFVAGQTGRENETGRFPTSLPDQFRQLLINTRLILAEAGARPEHVVRMTWFVLDVEEYRQHLQQIGKMYRDVFGKHYPAMAVVEVNNLVEFEAKIEIETTAVIPNKY